MPNIKKLIILFPVLLILSCLDNSNPVSTAGVEKASGTISNTCGPTDGPTVLITLENQGLSGETIPNSSIEAFFGEYSIKDLNYKHDTTYLLSPAWILTGNQSVQIDTLAVHFTGIYDNQSITISYIAKNAGSVLGQHTAVIRQDTIRQICG